MRLAPALPLLLLFVVGCGRRDAPASPTPGPVVLYTSVDEPYVKPLVALFTKRTGIEVRLETDAEASKTVGLSEKIVAERDHPKADVWWDNEVFHTVRLADAGVLAEYDSPAAADLPAKYRDPRHRWAGSALRVRVLISSARTPQEQHAHTMADLRRPGLRVALARPTAGTTGGHVAALTVAWGADATDDFFRALRANRAVVTGGNSVAAETVARGEVPVGLCDNDDAAAAGAEVGPLDVQLPDQQPGGLGTLAMPCAVSLVAAGPHPDAGRRLVDFLLSPGVDRALVDAHFAWCSARDPAGSHGRFMDVDYQVVAAVMPTAVRRVTAILDGR